jgi:hypothetical protein
MNTPTGLGVGGAQLWAAVTEAHDLDDIQLVQLAEACRAKDRCDRLADLLNEEHDSKLQADANTTANLMKQLLAALRLPDASGKRPQKPSVTGGSVSSLDRARARTA